MMPPDPLPVEEKISQLLEEIRSLSKQRDGLLASGDGCRPSAAQIRTSGEILRKMGIIDWILVLESRQRGRMTEEESAALDRCKALVQTAKEDLKAMPEDVRATAIVTSTPTPADTECAQRKEKEDSFHFYLDLPAAIVREKILSNLKSLQDKLNFVKAIPSEGPLMGWDEGSLQLQLLFPMFMERNVLDWSSLHKMSLLSGDIKSWMSKYFENYLLSDLRYYWEGFFETQLDSLQNAVQQARGSGNQWTQLSNPLTEVNIDFRSFQAIDDARRLRPILGPLGSNIWSCSIFDPIGIESPLELLTRIKNVLSLTPNLRKLHVIKSGFQEITRTRVVFSEEDGKAIEEMELPPLVSLKALLLINFGWSRWFDLVAIKLLNAYGGAQLEHLNLSPPFSGSQPGRFLRLTTLKLLAYNPLDVNGGLQKLAGFVNCPLQALYLRIFDVNARSGLPYLLRFLSDNFGDTLECLKLELGSADRLRVRPAPTPPPSSTWMLDVSFPKLKYFGMDDFPHPGDFSFLLCFPALEQICIEYVHDPREEIFEQETVVQLSFQLERMLTSNIWNIFPALRIFDINHLNFSNHQLQEALFEFLEVTRDQVIAHQQRLEAMPNGV